MILHYRVYYHIWTYDKIKFNLIIDYARRSRLSNYWSINILDKNVPILPGFVAQISGERSPYKTYTYICFRNWRIVSIKWNRLYIVFDAILYECLVRNNIFLFYYFQLRIFWSKIFYLNHIILKCITTYNYLLERHMVITINGLL